MTQRAQPIQEVTGTLVVASKDRAYVRVDDADDVLILGEPDRNGALHGDRVRVVVSADRSRFAPKLDSYWDDISERMGIGSLGTAYTKREIMALIMFGIPYGDLTPDQRSKTQLPKEFPQTTQQKWMQIIREMYNVDDFPEHMFQKVGEVEQTTRPTEFQSADFQFAVGRFQQSEITAGHYKLELTSWSTPWNGEEFEWETIPSDLLQRINESLVLAQTKENEQKQFFRAFDLGLIGNISTWTKATLCEHRILPRNDLSFWALLDDPSMDIGRVDMRNLVTFTIDPPNASDKDDAVSCDLKNGVYYVGVHIADVTAYLSEGSGLDKWIRRRGTSVYLQDMPVHMLPPKLVEECSLMPDKDRRAVSVIFEINPQGQIINEPHFMRSWIRSRAALTYKEAQDVIERKSSTWQCQQDIANSVRHLNDITGTLQLVRYQEDRPIRIDPNKSVKLWAFRPARRDDGILMDAMSRIGHYSCQEMIEELALLTNRTAAEEIYKQFPESCLLRRHREPFTDALHLLDKNQAHLGILTRYGTGAISRSDLRFLLEHRANPATDAAIRTMVIRAMRKAEYVNPVETDSFHYALGMERYTHMTSPIRRYADIVVHRMLFGRRYQHDELTDIIAVCNERNQAAKSCADADWNLHMGFYIKTHRGFDQLAHRAVITGIFPAEFAIEVFVIDYAIRRKMKLREDSRITKCTHALTGGKPYQNQLIVEWKPQQAPSVDLEETLQVFDTVKVRLAVSSNMDPRKFEVIFLGKTT